MYYNELEEYQRLNRVVETEEQLFESLKYMTEEQAERHLKVSLLDVNDFVKQNECPEVTNPLLFAKENSPTSDGLLSYELFGITKDERANIFGYINLGDYFIHPLCYKTWASMDSRIKNIVHGAKKYIITESGDLVEDEKGKTGIKFLKNNFEKIKFRRTDSRKRDNKIKFIKASYKAGLLFMNKMIIIPPYYRDATSGKNHASVDGINKLYVSLLIAANSLKETAEYGFSMEDAQHGRVQEIILNIYDYFCGNNNSNIDNDGVGLARKLGVIRRSVLSKTTDYGSRNILSAPNLRVERVEDLMADADHASVPVATVCTVFYPFVLFAIKRLFEDWFSNNATVDLCTTDGTVIDSVRPHDPLSQFNDDFIKSMLKRFLHGYSNRLNPIPIKVEDLDGNVLDRDDVFLRFKGNHAVMKGPNGEPVIDENNIIFRRATWLDIFYMAAVEASKDKTILITRFPIDSYYNQIPAMINVSSIHETETIIYDDEVYKWYPKITEEMIGMDTSNLFIDTLNISNIFLKGMVGDYDGDQVSIKGVYTKEANDELIRFLKSAANYADLGAKDVRTSTNEAIQALYNLTLALPGTELKIE